MSSLNVVDGTTVTAALTRRCDAVVVGSGPAGAAAARTLARAGLRVVVVEEGPHVEPGAYRADAFASMAQLYRDLGASLTRGQAPMPYLQGRAVGGTSVINGAISWRLPRDVHDAWCQADPAIAEALPWQAIDAVTDAIERDLAIAPTDATMAGRNAQLMARGAAALGLEHRPIARNVRGCAGSGRCLQGCPGGRKQSMDQSYLVDACAHGAEILASTTVARVVVDGARAVGVEAVAAGGGKVRIGARHVVMAASAIQTPALLLRSGLRQGPVGEHLQCHPGASMVGRFAVPVRLWQGATQGHEVIGLRGAGLKFEALGYDLAVAASRMKSIGRALADDVAELEHWASWGVAVKARSEGSVRPHGRHGVKVRYDLSSDDLLMLRRGVAVLGEMMLAAGAQWVTPGVHGFDAKVTARAPMATLATLGPLDARAYTLVATHLFGTCRLGSDPARSVVRPTLQHHAVGGLWVVDSSVFPSNTGVNPQTSILALATLGARHLVAQG